MMILTQRVNRLIDKMEPIQLRVVAGGLAFLLLALSACVVYRELLLLLLPWGIGAFYFSLLLAFILPSARTSKFTKITETVVSGLSVIFGILSFQIAQIEYAGLDSFFKPFSPSPYHSEGITEHVMVCLCLGSIFLGNSLLVLKAKWLAIGVLIMWLLWLIF